MPNVIQGNNNSVLVIAKTVMLTREHRLGKEFRITSVFLIFALETNMSNLMELVHLANLGL